MIKGRTPKEDWYAHSGLWLVKFRDIANNQVRWEEGHRTFVGIEHKDALRPLALNTILVSADAHDPKSIGRKVALVEDIPLRASPAYYAGELLGISVNEADAQAKWLLYWLQSERGYEAIQEKVSGVHLNVGPARTISIPLPPIDEQRRIVARLDERMAAAERAVRAARATAEAAAALSASLLRGAFAGVG